MKMKLADVIINYNTIKCAKTNGTLLLDHRIT